jgi:hypothetical protein
MCVGLKSCNASWQQPGPPVPTLSLSLSPTRGWNPQVSKLRQWTVPIRAQQTAQPDRSPIVASIMQPAAGAAVTAGGNRGNADADLHIHSCTRLTSVRRGPFVRFFITYFSFHIDCVVAFLSVALLTLEMPVAPLNRFPKIVTASVKLAADSENDALCRLKENCIGTIWRVMCRALQSGRSSKSEQICTTQSDFYLSVVGQR